MASHHRSLIVAFIDDTILLSGLALWAWMIAEALKPGIISFYWNLTTHWGVVITLIVLRVFLPSLNAEAVVPRHPPLSRWQKGFWWVAAGITVAILLREWGMAAISLGLLVLILTSSFFYDCSYETTVKSAH